MVKGGSAGIVRVLAGTGPNHAGMGILVGRRHLLTCAHVVNTAMGRPADEPSQPHPRAVIHVDFPFVPAARARAHWLRWRSPGEEAGDLALLELEDAASEAVGVATLADVSRAPTVNDVLSAFGYPANHPSGKHVDGYFKGDVGASWQQIVGRDRERAFVEGGYSGAAIWDETQDAIIGMVVARETSDTERVAYAIPTVSLKKFVPELAIETRSISSTFHATWATLATVALVLLLLHFLRTRLTDAATLDRLIFWAPDSQLAELWGMHVFIVLAPFLFGLLFIHAKSFRLHNWWQRVPPFRGRGPAASVRNMPISAAVSLFFFVILPLYMQGHFICQFHDGEGAVAIYPGDFGFTAEELQAANQTCSVESMRVCTHPQAGPYRLVEPVRGAAGNYWDNAYHYGNASDLSHSQTFFPILQPLVIYGLSSIAVLLAALSALTIARPRPNLVIGRDARPLVDHAERGGRAEYH